MPQFLAHSRNAAGQGVSESVRDHVQRVTELARHFASAFDAQHAAEVAGLLHDLGKYSEQFQRRLTVRGEPSRDHWSIGAFAALCYFGQPAVSAALAIQGHHVGLGEIAESRKLQQEMQRQFRGRPDDFTTVDGKQVIQCFQRDGFQLPSRDHLAVPAAADDRTAARMLDVRMLFSALVDADYLATEGHFAGDAETPFRPRAAGCGLNIEEASGAFDSYVSELRSQASPCPMQPVRERLAEACLAGADLPTGAYTLSAPTGSGKTLAMLAFALRHAHKHRLRRIVIVLPFLNIIEQTAKIYREIFADEKLFGAHFILEDHSLAENSPERSEAAPDEQRELAQRRRLLAENWDAPIILTTNVQLLESLHARKPARCRKLHRLARSVILFDEVQTLPPNLAKATLGTLSRLSDPDGPYGSTVVFATATQPAFSKLHAEVAKLASAGWQPRELVPGAQDLFALASGRVKVRWRQEESWSFSDLVEKLASQQRVLCIVNLKRHATSLVQALSDRGVDGVLHLSTNLCPAHRLNVLEHVRARLRGGTAPVRLIATQCVEAGVDLSFPTVMRSLGPLEAIAQAAGRCNRSGEGPTGEVIVFRWPTEADVEEQRQYPPGYWSAVSATKLFLQGQDLNAEILHAPEKIRNYYHTLYALDGRANGVAPDEKTIANAMTEESFANVAKEYRLINKDTVSVIVPYHSTAFESLQREAKQRLQGEELRDWFRRARPLTVSIYQPGDDSPIRQYLNPVRFGELKDDADAEPETTWFWLLPSARYDETVGLTFPADIAEAMIV